MQPVLSAPATTGQRAKPSCEAVRRLLFFLAFVAVALVVPGRASAHANLVRTDPGNGAVLGLAPARVEVIFDDAVRVGPGIEAVRNGGKSILAGNARAQGKSLVIPLRSGIGDGDYTVRWSIVADDGHVEQGVIAFGVGIGRPPPTASLTASNSVSADVLISRWLFIFGVLAAGGLALFDLVVARGRRPQPGLTAIGLVLVFLGAQGLKHGTPGAGATRFGVVMTIASVLAAAGAAAAAIGIVDPKSVRIAEAAAIALLAAPTLSGHALDPGRSWVDVPLDLLHVVASSFWFGGIIALALARDALVLARRFSPLALASVIAIAATGLGRALAELSSVSQVWTTGYGEAIAVKSLLLGALVVAAYFSRSALVSSWTRVRASVRGELVLLFGLVGAVGVLTSLPPGNRHAPRAVAAPPQARPASQPPPLPPASALVLAQRSGSLAEAVSVHPTPNGFAASVVFLNWQGNGQSLRSVRIDGKAATTCGSGCYAVTLSRLPVNLIVERPGNRSAFTLPRSFRRAGATVARATRAFHAQDAMEYDETLTSGLGTTLFTHWEVQKPNRLEYNIRGGSQAIIIGSRRWDRTTAKAKWVRSSQIPVTQPVPLWWQARITNAYVLESTPSTQTVSFLSRDGPAWFTAVLDRRSLLPRSVSMVASAHFMAQNYDRKPSVSIRPPR